MDSFIRSRPRLLLVAMKRVAPFVQTGTNDLERADVEAGLAERFDHEFVECLLCLELGATLRPLPPIVAEGVGRAVASTESELMKRAMNGSGT